MQPELTYLDYNATMPLRPKALEAIILANQQGGNASAVHRLGRQGRQLLDTARRRLARLLDAESEDIIFTSGGTESNNTILQAFHHMGAAIFVSSIEHACVLNAVPERQLIPVTPSGVVDLRTLEKMLQTRERQLCLISVMMANNETGVLQPVAEIVDIAKRYGALVHTDAVQAVGKIPVRFRTLGVDYLSLSAHKIGGPLGVGALLVRDGAPYRALMRGAGQEKGRRAGTSNVPGAMGFLAALEEALQEDWVPIEQLRDRFEENVRKVCPSAHIFSESAKRLPNTSCLTMPGVSHEVQMMAFDLDGICVSHGAACSSGKVDVSHVLKAMGWDHDLMTQAIRVSLGPTTTAQDMEKLLRAWTTLYERTRKNVREFERAS